MARVKVQDKYRAILDAAVEVFAERGFWDTPTSLISKTAGIADGTLFTYFKTKDDLIQEVYLDLKREMAREMLEGMSALDTTQAKLRHIWNHYVEWGVKRPNQYKVLQQISTSYKVADEVKAQAIEPFSEIEQMTAACIAQGVFRDYPIEYLGALIDSQAMMTIRFATLNPDNLAYYQQIGFDILWNGVTR